MQSTDVIEHESRRRRRRARRKPGAAPGIVAVDPEAPRPRIRVMSYGPDGVSEKEVAAPEQLAALLGKWPVTWVNVDGLGDAAVIEKLGEIFGLHRLALEDVVNLDQRAKLDDYDDHLFLVARMASTGGAATEQISLFMGKEFVLTFQERTGDCFDPIRERIRAGRQRIRSAGPDYLAYALLDALIDSYFPVVDGLGDRVERLEDEVVERPEKTTMAEIQSLKATLIALRRAIRPHRELIGALLREEGDLVAPQTLPYLRDCQDHAAQIIDLVESYREICADLVDVCLSSASNRMNEVMKVLTVIATIFIPLSFIAGVYGMNFNPERSAWNMPELNWAFGYPFALALMLAVAVGFLVYFHRKGWL